MDAPLLPDFLPLLAEYGPGLLFILAAAETSFVTGLVVPSGLATSAATVLALEGVLTLPGVALAAVAGGWAGDSLGFWVGSLGRDRLEGSPRRWARWLRGDEGEGARFFGRHPLWSVTVARLVSFVRTLMPMAAGVSGLRYRRFLVYEAPGLAGWLVMYMAVGLLARESWELATSILGVGWTVVFVVLGAALWVRRRRRTGTRRRRPPAASPPAPGA